MCKAKVSGSTTGSTSRDPMSGLEKALAEGRRTGYVLRADLEKLRVIQAETAKLLRLPEVPMEDPGEAMSSSGMVAALDNLGFYIREQVTLASRILSVVQDLDRRLS